MAMRQVGFHMLKHPEKFYNSIESELMLSGESYESYCYNVYHSNCWGDDLVAAAFADMWNVSISIVSPCYHYALDLWHNAEIPDIMIIANGGSYLSEERKTTHFSATRFIDTTHKKPGYELVNKKPGIEPHLVYKKLKPILLHDVATARKDAIDGYCNWQKEHTLNLLYKTTRNIEKLDKEVSHLIRALEKKKELVKKLGYQLISLGVSTEKVEIAMRHKEVPYMLTEEVEMELIREERKRKREEEEAEEERKRRKREMIVVKDGKVISTGDEDQEQDVMDEDVGRQKTLIRQQSELMKSQEVVIQTQDATMNELQARIKQLEEENQRLTMEKEAQVQPMTFLQIPSQGEDVQFPSMSNLNLPVLDPTTLDFDSGAGTSGGTSHVFSLE